MTKSELTARCVQLEEVIVRLVPNRPKNLPKLLVRPSAEKKGWFDVTVNGVPRISYMDFMSAHKHCSAIRTAMH